MATNNGKSRELERTLWATADKLRGHLDSAEYKHIVLGLIFLKYISDAFQELHAQLTATAATEYTDPEDPDEYLAANVFWVPTNARWTQLQANAKDPQIGILIDRAMNTIERDNPRLKGVLPQNYGRPELDKRRLGELIDLISGIALGDSASQRGDVIGQVYEYFLGQFASAEGKKGGEFYTPQSIVKLLVAILAPYKGRIYDPCCGAGGMFVQSEKFVTQHQGRIGDISVYGQESNPTTWKLAKMNLAIRKIEGNLGTEAADTFHDNQHPDLRADFVLANPPFNISDWGGDLLAEDKRWQYGTPPKRNANFAWLQHILHQLAPHGRAGVVLANGSMSSSTRGEGAIRQALVSADLVECMVALPPQLFFNTQIPACLWFLNRAKPAHRAGQTLFIDARNEGAMVDRTRRELSDTDITRIANTYHQWASGNEYEDIAGFCKSATKADIIHHDSILTPGRYVGAPEIEDDGEAFDQKMANLTSTLMGHFAQAEEAHATIRNILREIGYEI